MNALLFGDEKTSREIRVLRRFGCNRFILRHFPWLSSVEPGEICET